jgi:thymidylate synthase
MKQYLDMIDHVLKNGEERKDRTGTGTVGVFGYQTRYDLSKGFPLLTTKKLHIRSIIYELLWFLNGDTDIKYLLDNGVKIWNADAYRDYKNFMKDYSSALVETEEEFLEKAAEYGYDLGPIYGSQWRRWITKYGETIDQISKVLNSLKKDPYGRRHIVSAWNVADLDDMALPPCHIVFQFYVSTDGKLSCQLYQRSADLFLGVPFNIASYALLTHMIAKEVGLEVGEFIHTFGDLHIYKNHIEQVKEQMSREPKELPQLVIKDREDREGIFDYQFDDFEIKGYDPHPLIKGKVSVGK